MKKIIRLASVAIVIASLTGCLENKEPVGIASQREALSELIKANTQVELAEAEIKKADAAYRLAEVEGVNLDNANQALQNQKFEFEVETKRIELELEKIKNDNSKVLEVEKLKTALLKEEKLLSDAKSALVIAIETQKKSLLAAQEASVDAQRTLEEAIEEQKAALLADKIAADGLVSDANNNIHVLLNSKIGEISQNRNRYRGASENYTKEYDTYYDLMVNPANDPETDRITAENTISLAQIAIDGYEKDKSELENLNGATVETWLAKIAEWEKKATSLTASLTVLEGENDDLTVTLAEITREISDLTIERTKTISEFNSTPFMMAPITVDDEAEFEAVENLLVSNYIDYTTNDLTLTPINLTNEKVYNIQNLYNNVLSEANKFSADDRAQLVDLVLPTLTANVSQATANYNGAVERWELSKTNFLTAAKNYGYLIDGVMNVVNTNALSVLNREIKEFTDLEDDNDVVTSSQLTKIIESLETYSPLRIALDGDALNYNSQPYVKTWLDANKVRFLTITSLVNAQSEIMAQFSNLGQEIRTTGGANREWIEKSIALFGSLGSGIKGGLLEMPNYDETTFTHVDWNTSYDGAGSWVTVEIDGNFITYHINTNGSTINDTYWSDKYIAEQNLATLNNALNTTLWSSLSADLEPIITGYEAIELVHDNAIDAIKLSIKVLRTSKIPHTIRQTELTELIAADKTLVGIYEARAKEVSSMLKLDNSNLTGEITSEEAFNNFIKTQVAGIILNIGTQNILITNQNEKIALIDAGEWSVNDAMEDAKVKVEHYAVLMELYMEQFELLVDEKDRLITLLTSTTTNN